ncbi:hypothetical protein HAX54_017940 [Datura stramonium]|uniref:Sugar phosphate transporter domain-containing protein n=1 Tax=Datura stramonium TaxID=4076 RepID=A0ABS8S0Z1_DATST|nr:hypothetical protein [Datura stramonium]
MLTLNLLPSTNVTLSKSRAKYPVSPSPFDPNLGSRNQKLRNLCSPALLLTTLDSKWPPFQILEAASGTPEEVSPDGEIEACKAKSECETGSHFYSENFQNIVFNIYNKKVLNIFPYPWLLASFQLFCGSVWMLILWSFKLQPCPKINKSFIIALLGPALFHTIGHISACVSFSKVAVSFTHVIKSAEPVLLCCVFIIFGDTYPLAVWLSILPIVFGCSLAAVTEVSQFGGLSGAMISNVGSVLRNIFSKRSLQNFKEVDGLNSSLYVVLWSKNDVDIGPKIFVAGSVLFEAGCKVNFYAGLIDIALALICVVRKRDIREID